ARSDPPPTLDSVATAESRRPGSVTSRADTGPTMLAESGSSRIEHPHEAADPPGLAARACIAPGPAPDLDHAPVRVARDIHALRDVERVARAPDVRGCAPPQDRASRELAHRGCPIERDHRTLAVERERHRAPSYTGGGKSQRGCATSVRGRRRVIGDESSHYHNHEYS